MSATASQSPEYTTLVGCSEKLIQGISVDPLLVTNKLLEVGLASTKLVETMLLQSRDRYDKATEVVMQVISIVGTSDSTEKFEVFIGILKEHLWLHDTVELVLTKYQVNKRQGEVREGENAPESTGEEELNTSSMGYSAIKELQNEKKQLTEEIESRNEELNELIAVLASVQKSRSDNFKKNAKLEANVQSKTIEVELKQLEKENQKLQQRALEKEEGLNGEIQKREKEIKSLKNQLSLINDQLHQKQQTGPNSLRVQSAPPSIRMATTNRSSKEDTTSEASTAVKCCRFLCNCCCFIPAFVLFSIALGLVLTLPKLTRGSVTLGKSDVLLVSRFHSSQREVRIIPTGDLPTVRVYQGPCSKIGPFPQLQNSTQQVAIRETTRKSIDAPYLIRGSQVNYTFTVSNSDVNIAANHCVANIRIFINDSSYNQFIASGYISKLSLFACVSRTKPLEFQLSLTPTNTQGSRYYFIGLEGLSSATINITIYGEILEYDITNFSTTVCNFSRSALQCFVPLDHRPGDQETCLLVSQDADTFITLHYLALSHMYEAHYIAAFTVTSVAGVLSLVALLNCIIYCFNTRYEKGRKDERDGTVTAL